MAAQLCEDVTERKSSLPLGDEHSTLDQQIVTAHLLCAGDCAGHQIKTNQDPGLMELRFQNGDTQRISLPCSAAMKLGAKHRWTDMQWGQQGVAAGLGKVVGRETMFVQRNEQCRQQAT